MGVFDFLPGRGGDCAEKASSSGEASTGGEGTGRTDQIAEQTPADFRERAETLAKRSDMPTLDFTVDSLESLDDLATGSAGGIEKAAYGSYLGEAIIREYGGEWTDEDGWQVTVPLPDDRTTIAVFDAAEMAIEGHPVFSKVAARLEVEGAVRVSDVTGSPPDPDEEVQKQDGTPDSPASDNGATLAAGEADDRRDVSDETNDEETDGDDNAGDSHGDSTTDTVVVEDPVADDDIGTDDDGAIAAGADVTDDVTVEAGDDAGEGDGAGRFGTDAGTDGRDDADPAGNGGQSGPDQMGPKLAGPDGGAVDADEASAGSSEGRVGLQDTAPGAPAQADDGDEDDTGDMGGTDAVDDTDERTGVLSFGGSSDATGPVTGDDAGPAVSTDDDSSGLATSDGAVVDEEHADTDDGPSAKDVTGYSTTDYSAHRDVGTDDETEATASLADEVAADSTVGNVVTGDDESSSDGAPTIDADAPGGVTDDADGESSSAENGLGGGISTGDEEEGGPTAPERNVLRDAAEGLADGWPSRGLDFTPASLPRLDTFVEEQWDGRFRASSLAGRTVDHEDTGDPLAQLGAYYGEVLIRWLNGEWVATDDGEGAIEVPDVGEKVERVDVFGVARECLIPPSTFAYRYDALVNRVYVDEAAVSDGRADVFDDDRASLTSSDVITQFAETADEFVESWPKYPLDYSPRSVRALDEIAQRQTRDWDPTGVPLADGTDPESLRLTARATAAGAYFAAVLVRHRNAQWRIDGDDVELVVDGPTGERTVDPVATAADSLLGRGSFLDTYASLDD